MTAFRLLLISLASTSALVLAASLTASPTSAVSFRNDMRRRWEDHIAWTRIYIIEVGAGLPGKDATAVRLRQNRVDIGDAIKPYDGDDAGNRLTALLKDHISGAVNLLAAVTSALVIVLGITRLRRTGLRAVAPTARRLPNLDCRQTRAPAPRVGVGV